MRESVWWRGKRSVASEERWRLKCMGALRGGELWSWFACRCRVEAVSVRPAVASLGIGLV